MFWYGLEGKYSAVNPGRCHLTEHGTAHLPLLILHDIWSHQQKPPPAEVSALCGSHVRVKWGGLKRRWDPKSTGSQRPGRIGHPKAPLIQFHLLPVPSVRMLWPSSAGFTCKFMWTYSYVSFFLEYCHYLSFLGFFPSFYAHYQVFSRNFSRFLVCVYIRDWEKGERVREKRLEEKWLFERVFMGGGYIYVISLSLCCWFTQTSALLLKMSKCPQTVVFPWSPAVGCGIYLLNCILLPKTPSP